MNKIFAFALMVTSATFGQNLDLDKMEKLTPSQSAEMWSRLGKDVNRSAVNVAQAQATIEVTTSKQGVVALFSSLVPLPIGSFVSFRITLPGGTVLPMQGYRINSDGFLVGATLWDGSFPGPWIPGENIFEAMMESPGLAPTYVSASIPVRSCCSLSGPVQRADLSPDGSTINIVGDSFNEGAVVATVNGSQRPIAISFSPTTGQAIGTIDVRNVIEGEKTLTVCAGGRCSTRVIYITRPR
jgi:hypothetical protein